MPNPPFLLSDSDALIQVFMTRQRRALAELRTRGGMVTAVLPEVESEVCNHRKFRQQFEPEFQRTVKAGNLVVLERGDTRRLLLERDTPVDAVDRELLELEARCRDYNKYVDEGEAYTHAHAARLGLPVMSHDQKAMTQLRRLGLRVGHPTLRFFDLLVFAHGRGWVTTEECERARKYLSGQGEFIPYEFKAQGASFADCAAIFPCRLAVTAPGEAPIPPGRPSDVLCLELV